MDKSNFEIEHDGTKYERDNPRLNLVCTDFHQVVRWSQGRGGDPLRGKSSIRGTARIERDKLAVLGHPQSKTRSLNLTIGTTDEEWLSHYRSLIDLSTAADIGDPKRDEIATSWPLSIGYMAASPDDNLASSWYVEVYVPEAEFERIVAVNAPRMDLSIEIAAYGRPADLAFSVPWGRDLFLPGDKHGSAGGQFGRCTDLSFTLEGADRYAVPNADEDADGEGKKDGEQRQTVPFLLSKIERRMAEYEKRLKGIYQALLVLAVAAAAIAVHLLFG
jgi:hypothetical protein